MRSARLNYFKRSGKWYASGTIPLLEDEAPFQTFDRVREMRAAGRLPGLMNSNSHMGYIVHVDFPNDEFGYPQLLI